MNDFYAKDISKKTKSVLNARAKSGQYLASKPAYGYMKDPADNHKPIIDPVVQEMSVRFFIWQAQNSRLSCNCKSHDPKKRAYPSILSCYTKP